MLFAQIVMEYIHGGTLTQILGPTIPFPESCVAYVCREVLKGLAFMHRNHRLHRYARRRSQPPMRACTPNTQPTLLGPIGSPCSSPAELLILAARTAIAPLTANHGSAVAPSLCAGLAITLSSSCCRVVLAPQRYQVR